MRGFTLLELLIVLVILSLLLTVSLPALFNLSLSSRESFDNRLSSLSSQVCLLGKCGSVCVDFLNGTLSLGGESLKLPLKPKTFVVPGRLVSGEQFNSFCFTPSGPTDALLVLKEGDSYRAYLFLFPTGEVYTYNLTTGEADTLKDKVEKGRLAEWFRYY
ncbi:prepilin-type N-terminal cleavage/methylation domain-containing protein [Thermovibrio ammonificans]|jgi:prepilin-type N-terminal cleavage/methylation domain-containing protein